MKVAFSPCTSHSSHYLEQNLTILACFGWLLLLLLQPLGSTVVLQFGDGWASGKIWAHQQSPYSWSWHWWICKRKKKLQESQSGCCFRPNREAASVFCRTFPLHTCTSTFWLYFHNFYMTSVDDIVSTRTTAVLKTKLLSLRSTLIFNYISFMYITYHFHLTLLLMEAKHCLYP